MKMYKTPTSLFAATLLSVFSLSGAQADDTELYLNQVNLPDYQIRPNVVFILDSSGSMGLPVAEYGTSRRKETEKYDHSKTYTGVTNTTGGAGDGNYYYLYTKPNTYADQYIYHNKVHTSQMTCNMSTLNDSTPYKTSTDNFIYDDGTSNWGHLCAENEASCSFKPVSGGAEVDCFSEQNEITDDDAYPNNPDLYVVSANFHNFLQSYYRYAVLQTVMKDLIDEPFDINMSIMKFNGASGGLVIKESVDANLAASQTDLKTTVDSIIADGTTPLAESLWEAARHVRGESATYGSSSVSAAFSSGTTYDSPIDYACQQSHIILLTDGNANSDSGRDSSIRSLTGTNCAHSDNADAANESCLDDFAGWLYTSDASDPSENRRDHSTSLQGSQGITVHTIGFGLDNPLLEATATNGGGENKTASTAADLAEAFSTILNQLEFEKDTFVAPAVAVNAYNGLQHRDELYFALFQPAATPRWGGNIKKFKLVDGKIEATNGVAIDDNTGYFKLGSISEWTDPADFDTDGDGDDDVTGDGGTVSIGGFAGRLSDPTNRNIYTYSGTASPSKLLLTEKLDVANTGITTTMLGVDGEADPTAERTAIINWARGGVTGDAVSPPNHFVADLIHNRPSVVTYKTTVGSNGEPTFDDTIYAASNMGFFHAINPSTGDELFSFVPKELYGNLTTYYKDTGGFTDKVYGLDAPMTVWRNDIDEDGSIDNNDHVYIYQPMRRGGSNLYALDVTNRGAPKLLWQINGTALDASPSGDFQDLAQTWSVPKYGKVQWACSQSGCSEKQVLFFGGGYDPVHDDATSPTSSSKGNAIYMVDATTGDLLWSAGNGPHHTLNIGTMKNSITADITIGDVDSDGYIDFLFAMDIQGGLWRIDFSDDGVSPFSSGGQIADFSGTGSDFRRFYNAPDVAYFTKRGETPYLTVSVASGYRSHPRDVDINDYLFVIFDRNALSAPENFDYDYVGGTSNIDFGDLSASGTAYGWYMSLTESGEKGLSRTITFGDKIIMTTYVPNITSACEGTTGTGRYYLLDALTGTSLATDANDNPVPYVKFKHGGIPPEPAVIFTTEDVCVENCDNGDDSDDVSEERTDLIVCVGTECVDDVVDQKLHKTFWREN